MTDQVHTNPHGTPSGNGGRLRAFRRSTLGSVLINLVAAVVVIALVQTFFVKMYVVPSGSMQGTLLIGDRILVNRTAYAGAVPPRGDVVVFSADETWDEAGQKKGNPVKEMARYFGDVTGIGPSHEKFLVKRVIGVPGDVVDCCSAAGALQVNGVAQEEPYIQGDLPFDEAGPNCESTPRSARCFGPVTVPEGKLLVLGDHRGNSNDSVYACRGTAETGDCLKLVPVENVIGHTFATVLPLQRIGAVR
ncbi:signal peptidase I [Arthrobacter sp. PAMC 25486]|uniref:signal peptidase I n=1 Tax=Arthrobacter sp. PAMC 25486 TaxID=1494608 RepID=UPI0005363CFC|nr:signal peptidase I [Arthrobacter sp. PAMC 25486]AIY03580.1 signal peptidase I [Arthrobacter sp. PAMC 25486]